MKTEREVIDAALEYAEEIFRTDASGHDIFHMKRVFASATALAKSEGVNVFVVQLAALLHDVDDFKLSPETYEGKDRARIFMEENGVDAEIQEKVCRIIGEVSFRGSDSANPSSIEGMCVQDADRLDAIGAVGIARAFAYGGSRGRKIYDPDEPPTLDMDAEAYRRHVSTTLNHFYEKLFLLKDRMNTESAKRMAERRHAFMKEFVDEFLEEWDGRR